MGGRDSWEHVSAARNARIRGMAPSETPQRSAL